MASLTWIGGGDTACPSKEGQMSLRRFRLIILLATGVALAAAPTALAATPPGANNP